VGLSGKSSGWQDPPAEILVQIDTDAPGNLIGVTATVDGDDIDFAWQAPNSFNFAGTRIYRNTANNLGTAILIETIFGAPNEFGSYTDAGLDPDDYYYWLQPVNGSGWPGTATATGVRTVT
jgi:hypothetical protein